MKFTSISLKFSDLDEETAKLEIVLDPPLDRDKPYTEKDFEEQPCMGLAQRVMTFLQLVLNQESGGPEGGRQRAESPSIH